MNLRIRLNGSMMITQACIIIAIGMYYDPNTGEYYDGNGTYYYWDEESQSFVEAY